MSAAPALPVPFFEGAEKRVEIRYALSAHADNNASRGNNGLRDVPVAVWSASLAKAGKHFQHVQRFQNPQLPSDFLATSSSFC